MEGAPEGEARGLPDTPFPSSDLGQVIRLEEPGTLTGMLGLPGKPPRRLSRPRLILPLLSALRALPLAPSSEGAG